MLYYQGGIAASKGMVLSHDMVEFVSGYFLDGIEAAESKIYY
jgi:hypothetical protein